MDDPGAVGRGETDQRLPQERIELLGGQPTDPGDAGAEGLALQVLHDDEVLAAFERPEVQDLQDVIATDAPRRLRLALEARDRVFVLGGAGVQHLDRDPAADPEVLPFVDLAHATDADRSDDLVLLRR